MKYSEIAFVPDEKLKFLQIGMAIAAVTVMTAWQSQGQSLQGATAPAAPLAFEVASIKPVPPSIPTSGSPWIATHGRFKAETAYIRFMIAWAYNVLAPQVQGGPDWIDQERYYVDARAENPEAGPEQIGKMLQTLLTDRFKLVIHRETRQGVVYTLVVGKNGPKLQDAKDGQKNSVNWTGPGAVTFTENQTLTGLIIILSSVLNAPVLDKTNLRGSYNFSLEFIDPRLPQLADDDPRPNPFKGRPDLFTALQEQLGLQLQGAKGPVEVLVID
ncbi:MAG TPA: TIGR03435 family protein, partial [Blastocatellia bacterium]